MSGSAGSDAAAERFVVEDQVEGLVRALDVELQAPAQPGAEVDLDLDPFSMVADPEADDAKLPVRSANFAGIVRMMPQAREETDAEVVENPHVAERRGFRGSAPVERRMLLDPEPIRR